MKTRVLLLSVIIFLLNFGLSYGQTFEKKEAEKRITGSELVRVGRHKDTKFIKLKANYYYASSNQTNWLLNSLKATKNHTIKQIRREPDKKGFSHAKYQIHYKNVPVEGMVYTVHSHNGRIHSANGEFLSGKDITVTPNLSEKQAFDIATKHVNASKYKWDSFEGSRPAGILTILPVDSVYVLTYKFDIYATEPLSRQYIFVNANTGEVIKTINRIQTSDITGTARTMYNGNVSITDDSYNGAYRLREVGRGNGIETYNLNHGTSYSSAEDFTDSDNNWTDTIDYNHAANDAHYATEATYDYYYSKFGRNSYDNNGAKIVSYVHYNRNYVNAFWDGTSMTYGDGDGVDYLPLTPIEVVAHEITHGVTEHSAGLIYSGESGALNESFSDIFGIVIDFFKNPTRANYLMGDAMSTTHTPFRSMQNPNEYGNPDTYKGQYWDPYEEVHTNSGVQNFWFYLLAEGGTGTNDLGNTYAVSGIGRDKAAQIAYRNLTVYLTPSSDYADARFYSIQSAIDLFGDCSPEVIAVTNAWYAVGVGDQYNNSVVADFITSQTSACNIPSTISFYNRSSKAISYNWDFGDGITDTAKNPVHTYVRSGNFEIKLISTGNAICNHSDTIKKIMNVTQGQSPVPPSCTPHSSRPGIGGIFSFKFNSINKTTNGSMDNYQDYSCSDSTSVYEGRRYKLSIKVGSTNLENVYIWADLNNNGRLDDDGELIYQKKNVSKICSDSLIFPAGVIYDTPLRLRVASDYAIYNLPNACTDSKNGQYQDYTVYVRQNRTTPSVLFGSNKKNVISGDTVKFTDNSLNLPTSWSWTFPGGSPSTSNLKNPKVAYNTPGIYDVTLTVSNSRGSGSITKTGYIKVSTPAPVGLTAYVKNQVTGEVNLKWYTSDDANVFEDFEDGVADNFIYSDTCFSVENSSLKAYKEGDNSWKSARYERDFQDFLLEYKFQRAQGSSYSIGAFIRASDFLNQSNASGYLINVLPEGSYSAWKLSNGSATNLIPWRSSAAINTIRNAWNIVTIEAIGSVIKIYINSQYVDEFTDNTFTSGKINLSSYFGQGYTFDNRWDYVNVITNVTSASTLNLTKAKTSLLSNDGDYTKCPATNLGNNKVETKGIISKINNLPGSNVFNYYKIFRDSIFIKTTKNTSYIDTLPNYGTYKYFITSLYDDGESDLSNKVSVKWEELNPGENCLNAQDLSTLTSPYSSTTLGYKSDFTFCGMGDSPDRIFYIDVPNGYNLKIGQTFNDFDSRHSIRVGGSCPGTTMIECVDDPDIQMHSYTNTSGTTQRVYFTLAGYGSNYGNFTLAWNLKAPAKPTPEFYASQTDITAGTTIGFSDISEGIPTSWKWSFPGGSPSSSLLQNPTVTYNVPGNYNVKLVVANDLGTDSITKVSYIKVALPPKPIANFYSTTTSAMTGSSIYFYDNSYNSPTSWKWSFEGGTPSTSTSYNPIITYNTPGTYNVKLVVTNAGGSDSITKGGYITITQLPKPIANFYSSTRTALTGSSVYFYDNSSNYVTSRKWIFSGGTPSTAATTSPSVVYNTPGIYDVKLVVSNAAGSDSILEMGFITVAPNLKPTANFYTSSTKIIVGSSISFNDNSANNPTSWKWTFTGGTPSTSTSSYPYVTYNTPGDYSVKLVVANSEGSDSIIKTGYITVALPPKPTADFTLSTSTVTPGSVINFSDISSNGPTSWRWTFSGGTPSTSAVSNPYVTYNTSGTFDVKLVVKNAGGSDSITKTGLVQVVSVLPGDNCSNAQDLSALTSPYTSSTAGYASNFIMCSMGSSPDRVFYIDVPSGDSLRIGQLNNDFDSRHTLRVGGACPGTTEVACVDDPDVQIHIYKNNTASTQRAYFVLGGFGSYTAGKFTLYWRVISSMREKPSANFSADITAVSIGNYVNFSDMSSGIPVSWYWSFPGGMPAFSSSSSPSVYYNTPGTYNVKLVASNAYGSDSIIKNSYITVAPPPKPVANFYVSQTKANTGASIYFYNYSSNNPTSFRWTFTGGTPSSSNDYNPSVIYNAPGLYTVKLVASNAGGSDSIIKVQYITITNQPKPIANFYSSQTRVVMGNYVSFTSSSAYDPTSWKWTFTGGSPSTSTLGNPYVTYSTPGKYTVKLVVSNASGSDSITKTGYITVTLPPKPVADFYAYTTTVVAGSYAYFYDYSSNSPTSWKWTFTGGTPTAGNSGYASVLYNTPGVYNVKLVVSNAGGADSITKTGYITVTTPPKPVANFNTYGTNVVAGSYVYFYDNSSNSPTSWRWTFNGGTPSTGALNAASVLYNTPGVYDVKLVVGNAGGYDSIVKVNYITVTPPPKPMAEFSSSTRNTYTGTYVDFYDNSVNAVSSRKWYFSGGIPATSTLSAPSVVYNTPGVYDVKLVVSNSSGSDSIVKIGYITIVDNPKPIANFYANATNTFVSSVIYFTDNSYNNASSWRWSFSGGTPSTSTSSNPYVTYNSSGVFDVKLVVSNSSGSDSITKTGYITVTMPSKPVPDFKANATTITPGTEITFSDLSTNGPTARRWIFTGGSPSFSDYSNPYVVYNTSGTYDVKLVVSNAGGSDSITKTAYINVVSNLPGEDCSNAQDLSLLTSPYTGSTIGYKGDFTFCGMGSSPDRVFYIDVPNGNTLSIGQTRNDFDSRHAVRMGATCPGTTELLCQDDPDEGQYTYANTSGSTQRIYYVLGGFTSGYAGSFILSWKLSSPAKPVVNFTADSTNIVEGNYVRFTDQSSGIPTGWNWYFQGGSPSLSTQSDPTVNYSAPGTYKVKLIAWNAYGTDSIIKNAYITVAAPPKPVAAFYTNPTAARAGSVIYFTDNSTNNPTSRKWTFTGGTPSSSNDSYVSVVYNTPGRYTVKLVVTNAGGSDSIVKTEYITISTNPEPVANFYADQTTLAMGRTAYFYDNSGNYPSSWKWTFTGGSPSSSTSSNPAVYYSSPGVYSVKLVVSNSGGTDSITKTAYITVPLPPKPEANFYANSTSITKGQNVYFYDVSANYPSTWKWTFTGGYPAASTSSNPVVTYNANGTYDVKLVVSNIGGTDSLVKVGYINVENVSYCTSDLGGGSCPGDITSLSITGTTLNNTNHNTCSTYNNSTYGIYPGLATTTANLGIDKTYELKVVTTNADIISVWIDYNQNGVFESSEWKQVAVSSSPNTECKVNITIPPTALCGKTRMRIRTRSFNNPNGSSDACSTFGSGMTEDYIITINSINFESNNTRICKNDTVVFSSTYPRSNSVWDFGDGASPGTSNLSTQIRVVYTSTGSKTIRLIIDGDTLIRSNYISVNYPNTYHLSSDTSYCAGTTTTINLAGSSLNTTYQLLKDGVNVGEPKAGTGNTLNWASITKGAYKLTAKIDNLNCVAYMPDVLSITEKAVPLTPTISQSNKLLSSSYTNGNQWYLNQDEIIANAKNQTLMPTVNGNYYTIVTENGCQSTKSNVINVVITDINGIEANAKITFFPNPARDKVYIKSDNEIAIDRIEIRNEIGVTIIKEVPDNQKGTNFSVDVSRLPAGYYAIILFMNEKEVITNKIIKLN